MDSVVVILSIFSVISLGVIVFLINDRRTKHESSKLGDELERKITSSIEEVVLINDFDNNELRALIYLNGFGDRYLYVTREVDGTLFNLLDETQKTAILYQQMESDQHTHILLKLLNHQMLHS